MRPTLHTTQTLATTFGADVCCTALDDEVVAVVRGVVVAGVSMVAPAVVGVFPMNERMSKVPEPTPETEGEESADVVGVKPLRTSEDVLYCWGRGGGKKKNIKSQRQDMCGFKHHHTDHLHHDKYCRIYITPYNMSTNVYTQ